MIALYGSFIKIPLTKIISLARWLCWYGRLKEVLRLCDVRCVSKTSLTCILFLLFFSDNTLMEGWGLLSLH